MKNREQAILNDVRIMELALYHETKGHTIHIRDLDAPSKKFVEFKRYIMRGSFTIEQLEDRVYKEFGIMGKDGIDGVSSNNFLNAVNDIYVLQKERDEKSKGK